MMPHIEEIASISNDLEALRTNFQEPCRSWTDDLPVCPFSGVGFSTNQKYRADGFRREEHSFEDRSFHFKCYENTYFYGVFDGHNGPRTADFTAQRIPAEILLGQLIGKESDAEVQEILRQAFLAVEKGFFESIDDLLAEKEKLRLQLQGLRTIEAIKQFPEVVQRLKNVTEEIRSETTAVVALIVNNKLYIANVGDSRAILCREDSEGKLGILPLTLDHTFNNDDELLRLSHLGLNVQQLKDEMKNCPHKCTRCIGNYTIKGGYKEFDYLSEAEEEPIIAEPNIFGGIPIDEKCKFLVLMSEGLYRSLEEATDTPNSSALLVHMLLEEFQQQSTLNGVAQAVVDKIVRTHHDAFMTDSESKNRCQKREDITLLVRNFNCSLPKAPNSVNNYSYTPGNIEVKPDVRNQENVGGNNTLSDIVSIQNFPNSLSNEANSMFPFFDSQSSSSESAGPQALFQSKTDLSLDEDGKIKPYVDFTDVYAAIEEAKKDGFIIEED